MTIDQLKSQGYRIEEVYVGAVVNTLCLVRGSERLVVIEKPGIPSVRIVPGTKRGSK